MAGAASASPILRTLFAPRPRRLRRRVRNIRLMTPIDTADSSIAARTGGGGWDGQQGGDDATPSEELWPVGEWCEAERGVVGNGVTTREELWGMV